MRLANSYPELIVKQPDAVGAEPRGAVISMRDTGSLAADPSSSSLKKFWRLDPRGLDRGTWPGPHGCNRLPH
jgi:hypothetical protein